MRATDPGRWARFLAVAGLSVLLAASACTGGGPAGPDGPDEESGWADREPVLVYLSGLDDHLLPAYDTVPLHREPDGPVTADVPTDALGWVHDRAGQWLEVALVEPQPRRGWIADFYLRGELHIVDPDAPGCPVPAVAEPGRAPHHHLDPSTRVRLVDLAQHGSGTWVRVRTVSTGASWWVPRRTLSEPAGPDIRRAEPGSACAEITAEPVAPHTH